MFSFFEFEMFHADFVNGGFDAFGIGGFFENDDDFGGTGADFDGAKIKNTETGKNAHFFGFDVLHIGELGRFFDAGKQIWPMNIEKPLVGND